MDARSQRHWDIHDFAVGRGLEVGPLHRPIVAKSEAEVHYVDVRSRDELVAHYAGDPHVPADAIPEIDYALIVDDRTRTLVEAVSPGAPFDWVVASHVIEHIPDVVGWLAELAEVVVDDGTLVLTIPDRRYCFDVLRPPTTVGQMLVAHAAEDRRPSPAAVFDYFARSVDNDTRELWAGAVPGYDRIIHGLEEAQDNFDRALAGDYIDCHVWLFTPDSFLRQMHELRLIGRSSWIVDSIQETPVNDLEFSVTLRRIARGADTTSDFPDEQLSALDVPDWMDEQARGRRAAALERHVARLEERLSRKDAKIRRLRRQLRRRRGELEGVRERQASSRPSQLPGRAARSLARRLRGSSS